MMHEDVEVTIPAYCGLSENELEQRKPRVIEMMKRAEGYEPVEGGYRFTFPGDRDTLALVTTFATNERVCCPMAQFRLSFSGSKEPIELTMQGPEGIQADIREGLQLERWFDEEA